MKVRKYIGSCFASLCLVILSGHATGVAAQDRGNPARPSSSATQPSSATQRDGNQPGDRNMSPLMQLMEMNVAEVEVGKVASTKAQNPHVKDFAAMMVKDHNEALTKIRPHQSGGSDVKPNTKHQQTADRLSKLSGAEFDREYMKAMVADHQEAMRFLEQHSGKAPDSAATSGSAAGSSSGSSSTSASKGAASSAQRDTARASSDSSSSDLGNLASELLPTVRQHLQMAQQIDKDLRNTAAPNDSQPASSSPSKSPPTDRTQKKPQ